MLGVSVTYSPRLSPAERELAAIPGRLRNFKPLFEQGIAPAAEAMLFQHWDSKGAAFGHPWAPWKPSTLASRIKKGNVPLGILRDTDALFKAMFRAVRDLNRLQVTPGGLRLALGLTEADDATEALIAMLHQLGTKRMVARQVVPSPLPRSFRDTVRAMVHDYVATGRVRGAGGRFVSSGSPV